MSALKKYDENFEEQYENAAEREKPHIVRTGMRGTLDKPMRSKFRTAFLLFTVLAMTVTIRSGISASRGYVLVNTQQQAQAIEQENARLRIEIAHLKSPQRIRDIAVKELGMEEPTKVYFGRER